MLYSKVPAINPSKFKDKIEWFETLMSKQLTPEKRAQIIILHEQKMSTREIAKILRISQPTVVNTIHKFVKHNTFNHLGGNGRPRLLNDKIYNKIKELNESDKTLSLRKISNKIQRDVGINISYNTIRNYLNEMNIYAYSCAKKPLLTPIHKEKRFAAAEKWIQMTEDETKKIIFSDETKINLLYSDGNCSTWRKKEEKLLPGTFKPTLKYGGGSLMIWGCFSYNGVGRIHFVEGKMDGAGYCDILSRNLLSSAHSMGLESYIFMHDNDPKHKSKIAQSFLTSKKIEILNWPAQSPDMNPIENLWRFLKVEVAKFEPKSILDLKEAVVCVWNAIPVELCQKLALSFRKRSLELYRNKGGYTSY